MELGNEINWTAPNPEFPLPGKGINFGLGDPYHGPEGKRIAEGYLQYLKILTALKGVRDHSKLNRHAPIILAGLADDDEVLRPKSKTDSVGVSATIQFLRANGLDQLVDFHGIHTYPWEINPARRKSHLETCAVAEWHPSDSQDGKPCWITEWGMPNKTGTCPLNDDARAALVKETMGNFRDGAKQGRLIGAMYFAWDSDPLANRVEPFTVYRCGALTKGGELALSP